MPQWLRPLCLLESNVPRGLGVSIQGRWTYVLDGSADFNDATNETVVRTGRHTPLCSPSAGQKQHGSVLSSTSDKFARYTSLLPASHITYARRENGGYSVAINQVCG